MILSDPQKQKLAFIRKKLGDNSSISESENAFLVKLMDQESAENAGLIILSTPNLDNPPKHVPYGE